MTKDIAHMWTDILQGIAQQAGLPSHQMISANATVTTTHGSTLQEESTSDVWCVEVWCPSLQTTFTHVTSYSCFAEALRRTNELQNNNR